MGLADAMMIERIRQATRDGRPLGSDEFLEHLQQQFGVKTRKPYVTPQLNQTESGASSGSATGASA
jgi:hypothetical protein